MEKILSVNLLQTVPEEKFETGLELMKVLGNKIRHIHMLKGEYDLLLELDTKNEFELSNLIKNKIKKLGRVFKIKTMLGSDYY